MTTLYQAVATLKYEYSPYFDKFKETSYVGKKDDCPTGYRTHFDSTHPELVTTPNHSRVCLFCGSECRPIQGHLNKFECRFDAPSWAYETTGYYCTCTHAADWIEKQKQLAALEEEYNKAKYAIKNALPRENENIKALVDLPSDTRKVIVGMMKKEKAK